MCIRDRLNGGLGNIFGGGMSNCYVNRYEMTMAQELAAKDGKIALLEADKYTDEKMVEVYKDLVGQINALAAQIQANKDEQYGVNMQQAVYNGTCLLYTSSNSIKRLLGFYRQN